MNKQSTLSVKVNKHGGPEALSVEEHELSSPGSNEVLIRHHAIGVNFVDTYYRSGLYQAPLPFGLGTEAAGVIEAVGKDVTHLKAGDRVAYATGPLGSYAERRLLDSQFVVKIPAEVSYEQAASVLLKGLTVHYLFKSVHRVSKGEQILFHAAAGGVGLIACQWARHLGAELIGTVSSEEKAKLAIQHGASKTINYVTENVPERVFQITEGRKVPVVFDSVGKSTWEMSLDCLRSKGLMVSFGNASGPVTGVNLGILSQKGSLFVTRPILAHYVSTRDELVKASEEVFHLVKKGIIDPGSPHTFSLSDVVDAHKKLEDRKRTGTIILVP